MTSKIEKSNSTIQHLQGVSSVLLRIWILFSKLQHRYNFNNGIAYFYLHNEEMRKKALKIDVQAFDKLMGLLEEHLQELMRYDAIRYIRIYESVEVIDEFTKGYVIPLLNDESTYFTDQKEMLSLQLPKASSIVYDYLKLLYTGYQDEYKEIEQTLSSLTKQHENELIDFGVRMFDVYVELNPIVAVFIPDHATCKKVISSYEFSFLLQKLFQTNAFNKLSISKGYLGYMGVYYSTNSGAHDDNLKKATTINYNGVNAIIQGLTKLYITEQEEEMLYKGNDGLYKAINTVLDELIEKEESIEEENEINKKIIELKDTLHKTIYGNQSINRVIRNMGARLRLNRIKEAMEIKEVSS